MKRLLVFFVLLYPFLLFSQEVNLNRIQKTIKIKNSTIVFDSLSVSPLYFKLFTKKKKEIDSTTYSVNFPKATLFLKDEKHLNTELIISYESLPSFLTKTYQTYDKKMIVASPTDLSKLYTVKSNTDILQKKPFDGLETDGSLSRGITMGNNQGGVLNSNFNLQLTGSLGSKVKLRASITDNNLPLQENGYTQRLNEFDRVYIELLSKNWKINAGDVVLKENDGYFSSFTKKVAGIAIDVSLNHKNEAKTSIFSSGALVEGKFTEVDFNAIDANQGPYRLAPANKPFLLIISNSETVYVDGRPLKRGKDADYVIDYNTAEIIFATTFPVNSNMRIHVKFQASEQNYTRFVTHNKIAYQSKKLDVQVGFYNENDAKSKTLQQDFNVDQLAILANAGDDLSQMNSLSAIAESYIENKIQYKKEIQNTIGIYVFSTNEQDTLYDVRFNLIGNNQGNYIIKNTIATGRIYEYVAPINGVMQGSYEPVIQLIAANKLQLASFKGNYKPNKKTNINTEFAFSSLDKNLFSALDDSDNDGVALKLDWQQLLLDKKWKLSNNLEYELLQQNFNTIENVKNIEFERDWNLTSLQGNQSSFKTTLLYQNDTKGFMQYQFENLLFGDFKGNRHKVNTNLMFNKSKVESNVSFLQSKSSLEETNFLRFDVDAMQKVKRFWVGARLQLENNKRKEKATNQLTNKSYDFIHYNVYFKTGDSTKTNLEIGYSFRRNDSLEVAELKEVNKHNSLYLKSNLIQKKASDLSLYLNYTTISNTNFEANKSLNSRLQYRQQLFANFMNLNTIYETSSGSLPQQEFNYVLVDPGQGYYTWIDFNNDTIQDLDEFEIAQFQDQATYVRVLLPTTAFARINQTNFSQSFHINMTKWTTEKGIKKVLSHFSNQANLQVDNKHLKQRDFQLDPLAISNALAVNYNIKNSLYFNRGKQKYSTTYTYLESINKTVYATGLQENTIVSNQLSFQHKLNAFWLVNFNGIHSNTNSNNERYVSRNSRIKSDEFLGKLSYFHNMHAKFDLHYKYVTKNNALVSKESLFSNKLGTSLQYSKNEKLSLTANFNYIVNDFKGNSNTPIAFQLLEGLQNGKNYTWGLILQKKIGTYLDLNLSYIARKSPDFKSIHTGTIQLRANF